jgi:transcriptional regulator with XRE-family HTH domain
MPRERELDATLSPLAFFGAEVRRARTAAGMSLADLGHLVPCDKSTVSRVESGLLVPDEAFARACDEAFPAAGCWFTRFYVAHAKWDTAMPFAFRSFIADEARATALYTFEHSLIPGLLATEGYSRAVLSRHLGVSAEQVTARVAARMARQAILDREDPPLLWAVIDDAALSRCVGSPDIMRDALIHLASVAARPNVTIQVLADAGAHVGLQGAFTVAEVTGSACSVNMEDIADGRVCDDAATVGTASVRFRWLQSEAMPASASQAFIERMAGQWTQAAPGGARRLTPVPAAGSASK